MSIRTEQLAGGNVFRLHAVSGLIAGAGAAGVGFALRNPSADKSLRLLHLSAKARTIAGFTAAQELALAAHLVTSFASANYSGGTDLSNPASAPAYRNVALPLGAAYSFTTPRTKSVLTTGCARISDTSALTHGGAPTIQAAPLAWDAFSELATGATIPTGRADLEVPIDRDFEGYLELPQDSGVIVRFPVALGAGGTVRLAVTAIWAER
jgi:hypothetical protein